MPLPTRLLDVFVSAGRDPYTQALLRPQIEGLPISVPWRHWNRTEDLSRAVDRQAFIDAHSGGSDHRRSSTPLSVLPSHLDGVQPPAYSEVGDAVDTGSSYTTPFLAVLFAVIIGALLLVQ